MLEYGLSAHVERETSVATAIDHRLTASCCGIVKFCGRTADTTFPRANLAYDQRYHHTYDVLG